MKRSRLLGEIADSRILWQRQEVEGWGAWWGVGGGRGGGLRGATAGECGKNIVDLQFSVGFWFRAN